MKTDNKQSTAIVWLRQDLRLRDNPALVQACKNHTNIILVYILDDINTQENTLGAASKVWLHHALASLTNVIDGKLHLYQGNPLDILLQLAHQYKVNDIYWNRCYEPWQIKRDTAIKQHFAALNIHCHSTNSFLLWEPWQVHKKDGTAYKVFTPYFKKGCLNAPTPRVTLAKPDNVVSKLVKTQNSLKLDELKLLPSIAWDKQITANWKISEAAAQKKLQQFIENKLTTYKDARDCPAQDRTSQLSAYLHFGQISPHQILEAVQAIDGESDGFWCFYSELAWREFSYYLLYHFPDLPTKNWQAKFDNFPWQADLKSLTAWQQGQTGYPIVDAGMRQLWQTGTMHNRVRMIVASFLVKNLNIHWRQGAQWFWDCLVDADLASNSASWQWVAGCGADAAPYFRIFNPVLQAKKFDPQGNYIKKYLPELAHLPQKHLFEPWLAPESILESAGITLGKNYPLPIVDLKTSREQALSAYTSIKNLNAKS